MIQLTSRAGNFSSPRAAEPSTLPAARPSAALPAFVRTMRRSIPDLLSIACSFSSRQLGWGAAQSGPSGGAPGSRFAPRGYAICSMRRRQPNPQALFERMPIQEVCQRHVLRHKPGGVDEDAFIVALTAHFRASDELVDLGVKPIAREQAAFDHALELALQQVEFPAVDDDLVELRPAGGIELAARQRDEGAAGLEPGLAADHLARGGAADRDVGAAHDRLDRIHRYDRNAELVRPFLGERRPRLRPARGAADFLEPVHGGEATQRVGAHGADADQPEDFRIFGADPLAGDGGGRSAADGVAPVLVDDGDRLAASGIGQHDIARAAEAADG